MQAKELGTEIKASLKELPGEIKDGLKIGGELLVECIKAVPLTARKVGLFAVGNAYLLVGGEQPPTREALMHVEFILYASLYLPELASKINDNDTGSVNSSLTNK